MLVLFGVFVYRYQSKPDCHVLGFGIISRATKSQ